VRSAVRDALTTPTGGGVGRLPGCMNGGSVAMKLLHGPTSVVSEEASAERQLVVVDGIPAEKALWYAPPPPLPLPSSLLAEGVPSLLSACAVMEGGREGGVRARTHVCRQAERQTDR
jgi:hypothetical protein